MTVYNNTRRSQLDRSTETRSVLTTAAIEVLRTVGCGATTQIIAKQAGVTTGAGIITFLARELMLAVLDRASSQLKERLKAEGTILHAEAPPNSGSRGAPLAGFMGILSIGRFGKSDHRNTCRPALARAGGEASILHNTQNVLVHGLPSALPSDAREDVLQTFEFMLIAIRGLGLAAFGQGCCIL